MDNRYFSDKVVEWYKTNKRDLPWRETDDPYKIWLSEIILQQTRVNQGIPYYLRFVEKFPTYACIGIGHRARCAAALARIGLLYPGTEFTQVCQGSGRHDIMEGSQPLLKRC